MASPLPTLLGLLALCAPAWAQDPAVAEPVATPITAPVRLAEGERPTIDGKLDEPLWQRVPPIGALTQVTPDEGEPPTQRTEVRLAFDEHALYVAIACYDDDVATLRATQRRRDANLDPDDSIELLLDPFLDRRNAFWFQIGPGGARGDALIIENGSSFNKRWDAIWSGRTVTTDEGWFAELELPFASLNFDAEISAWGFNFRRYIRRRDEEARWSSPDRNTRFFSVAQAGTITGLSGLDQGLGLDITPFVLGGWSYETESGGGSGQDDHEFDAGLDAFWQPTPDSKLSLSFNTDFAETEVDQARVNLTRFSLFFPEKRDFFLEDSGYFQFGSGGSDVVPFFSRRIGLAGSGDEIPINAALKYTGRTETGTFGLLDAWTDQASTEDGLVDSQNLFAGRYSHYLDEETRAGLILTSGDPDGADTGATTLGLDYTWRTNDFAGDDNLTVSAYAVAAENDPDEDQGGMPTALHASIDYPNDELQLEASVTYIDGDFDPALGYVRRPGTKKYRGEWRYRPYLDDDPLLKRLFFSFRPTLYTDTANNLETLRTVTEVVGLEFDSGDRVSLDLLHNVEILDDDFDLLDELLVPAGRYEETRAGIKLRFADRRELAGSFEVFTGDFWDGTRTDYELELDWRPGPLGSLGLELERNELDLVAGSRDIHVARLRTDIAFTPDLSWSTDLQWDDVSEDLTLNSRVWAIVGPGREVFLVLDQGWSAANAGFVPTATSATVKLGYTLRF